MVFQKPVWKMDAATAAAPQFLGNAAIAAAL
jgi:hypothetical protein